jgi:gliding motility-associated protein GldC
MAKQTSDIRIAVSLDEEHAPEAITWEADEAPEPGEKEAKGMLLALWDAEARNALRIDLWTKEMSVDDMSDFFFQTFLSLADTYLNATGNRELMADIKQFARDFAKRASEMNQT